MRKLEIVKLDDSMILLPANSNRSNFLNQLHAMAFMSEEPDLDVLTVKCGREILSIFQVDRRKNESIIRMLGSYNSEILELITTKYRPDIIVDMFSDRGKTLATLREFYVSGYNIDSRKLPVLIPERYKKYMKFKIEIVIELITFRHRTINDI